MKKSEQKKHAHLPAVRGGIVTSVREDAGQVYYRYRVPASVIEKQRKAAGRPNPSVDTEDIGQGEGCEGGKCEINNRRGKP